MKKTAIKKGLISAAIALFAAQAVAKDEVTFWLYEPDSLSGKKAMDKMVKKFEKESGEDVKLVYIEKGSFNTKLNVSIATGTNPDIAYLDQPLIPIFAEDGVLENLTPYAQGKYPVSADDYYQGAYNTNLVDGELYGLPLNHTTIGLFYNKALVATPPKTWGEWLSIAEKIDTSKYAAFEGLWGGGGGAWQFPAFVHSAGGEMVDIENSQATFGGEEGVAAAAMLKKLLDYSPSEIRTSSNAFGNGLVAFKVSGPWEVNGFRSNFPGLDFGLALIPAEDSYGKSHSNIGGENVVVFKGAKNPEAAYRLARFITNEENGAITADVTGNFPANKKAVIKSHKGDEVFEMFYQQLETAESRPRLTNWLKTNDEIIGPALDRIFNEDADPAVELPKAESYATKVLF
jgi:multiple sugar transport system substrate-binding protein